MSETQTKRATSNPLSDDKLPISPRYEGRTPGDAARKLFRPTWKVPRKSEQGEGENSTG